MNRLRLAPVDRFTWLVVAAVGVLAAAALGSVLVNRALQQAPDQSSPPGVVVAYIQAIQEGQADRAWDLLDPDTATTSPEFPRRPISREEFRRQVQDSNRDTSSRIRIVTTTQSGETATVQVEVTTVSGDLFGSARSRQVFVTLRLRAGSWLITSDVSPWQFR